MPHNSKIFKTKVFEWVKDGDSLSLQEFIDNTLNNSLMRIKQLFQMRDHNSRSVLHWACFLGRYGLLQWWFKDYPQFMDLSIVDNEQYTPLDLACVKGYADEFEATNQHQIVSLLLANGATFCIHKSNRPSPLFWAFYYANQDLIQLIITKNFQMLFQQIKPTGEYPIDYLFLENKEQQYLENTKEIFSMVVDMYMYSNERLAQQASSQNFVTPHASRKNSKSSYILPRISIHKPDSVDENRFSIEQEPRGSYNPSDYSYEIKHRLDIGQGTQVSKGSKTSNPMSLNRLHKGAQRVQQNIFGIQKSLSSYNSEPEEEKIPQFGPSLSPLRSDIEVVIAAQPMRQFDKQTSGQSVNRPSYVIYHKRKSMSKAAHLETRFLYWSSYLGLVPMVKLFMERKASPFMRDNKGMNALQTAAYMGHLPVLNLLLEADYTYLEQQQLLRAKKIKKKSLLDHTFSKSEVINLHTRQLPSTALHLAIEQDHYDCMKLLIDHHADTELNNYRTLKPFELTYNDKILHYYRSQIKPKKDELNFGDQDYIYVLQTPGYINILQDIVYLQLQNIFEVFRAKGWKFEFLTILGPDLDRLEDYNNEACHPVKPKYHFYVIKLSPTTIYQLADMYQIQCYNLKKKYICTFKFEESMYFEYPRDLQVHQLILNTLNSEFDVEKFLIEKLIISHFPLEDRAKSQKITDFWKKEQNNCIQDSVRFETDQNALRPLHAIAMYYGPVIGWYFAFMVQLLGWLQAPSVLGVALGLYIYISEENQPSITPVYALFMMLWSTFFLEKWKRRESELRFCWDMHNYKAREPERVMYTGNFTINQITQTITMFDTFTSFKRRLVGDIPIIMMGFFIIGAVFYVFLRIDQAYEGDTKMQAVFSSLNGAAITVMSALYKVFCEKLVLWENHRLNSELEVSYILKVYLFEFVNSYTTVFYYAAFKRDAVKLSSTVGSIVITRGIIQNVTSNIIPFISYRLLHRVFERKFNTFKQIFLQKPRKAWLPKLCYQEYVDEKLTQTQQLVFLEQLEETTVREPSKLLFDEYTSIAIQFGYVTMFAPSFPAAPVFVMINLIINLRFSVYNYQNVMKREINLPADSIGIWLDIFSIMAYAATFMNCLIIYTVNYEQMSKLIGVQQGFGLAMVLVLSEHVMFCIKFILQFIIDDSPTWVEIGLRRYEYLEKKNDFQ